MNKILLLRAFAKEVSATVELNAFPIMTLSNSVVGSEGVEQMKSLSIHEYVLTGVNTLRWTVNPWPINEGENRPKRIVKPNKSMGLSIQILLLTLNESTSEERILFQHMWRPDQDKPIEFPLTEEASLDLPVKFPKWRWVDAPVITDNAENRGLALDFYHEVIADLSVGSSEKLEQYSQYRTEEVAIAYRISEPQLLQSSRDQIIKAYQLGQLELEPKQSDSIYFRPVANGRLWELRCKSGEHLLSTPAQLAGHRALQVPVRIAIAEKKVFVLR
jgi:hypothetical protein